MASKELEKQTEMNTNSISLIQKDLSYMTKGIDDIKTSVKDLGTTMTNGFATKSEITLIRGEIKSVSDRVIPLEKAGSWVVKIVLGAIILALLALLGLGLK